MSNFVYEYISICPAFLIRRVRVSVNTCLVKELQEQRNVVNRCPLRACLEDWLQGIASPQVLGFDSLVVAQLPLSLVVEEFM